MKGGIKGETTNLKGKETNPIWGEDFVSTGQKEKVDEIYKVSQGESLEGVRQPPDKGPQEVPQRGTRYRDEN